jgi:hypothetical protein
MKNAGRRSIMAMVIAGLLASCGGSSGSSQGDVSDSSSPAGGSSEIVRGNDCVTAVSAFNAVNQDVIRALPSPESLDLDQLKKNIEIAKSVVPSEIESEFALFADTFGEVGEILSRLADKGGLSNPENASEIAALESRLEDKDFSAAMDRLQQFFLSECA